MTVYYVRKDGSDSNAGTADTAGGAFLTIQKFLNVAAPGDQALVRAGTYYERLTPITNGTALLRITLNAETDSGGNSLVFVDGSDAIGGAWSATTDHSMGGLGVYENSTISGTGALWEATNFQLIHQIDPALTTGLSDSSYTQYTAYDLLSKATNFQHPYADAPIWNGIEAACVYSAGDGKEYIRYRAGTNPNGRNLRWSVGANPLVSPSTGALHLNGMSYYTFNNFTFQGAWVGVYFNGKTLPCESNIILGGQIRGAHYRTYFEGRANYNIVRNMTLRSRLIGFVTYPVTKSRGSVVGYDVDTNTAFNQYAYDKFYWGRTTERDASVKIVPTSSFDPTGNEIAGNIIFEGCQAANWGGDGNGGGNGTLFHGNTVYQHASQAIYIQPTNSPFNSPTNWEIYDNYFWRNNHVLRSNHFHHNMGTCYFDFNRCEDIDGYSTFVTFYKANAGEASNFLTTLWFAHNSFKGGHTMIEYAGVNSGTGFAGFRAVNNAWFTNDRTMSSGYLFDFENVQARIGAWGNNTKRAGFSFVTTPAWVDAGNANITTLWNFNAIDNNFAVIGTALEQSALNLSQPFTIRGTLYSALPKSRYNTNYFTGVAPNRGAIQNVNPTPPATLAAAPGSMLAGATCTATWTNVTTTTDWVGLYVPGALDNQPLDWVYTSSGTQSPGGSIVASGSYGFTMNVAAGSYEFRLFFNDGYVLLDASDLVIVTVPGSGSVPGTSDIIIF